MNCSIQFPSWPSALSFFLPLLPLLILFILGKMKNSKTLPPGPTKLPIIGNIHNLLLSGDDHIPRVFRDLANKYGPFLHMKIGHISQIIVSSSELAEQFLKTHDVNFATRPDNFAANIISYNRKDVAFAPYGEYWRQMRKVCVQTLLSFKRVKSFDGTRADENHNLANNTLKEFPVEACKLRLGVLDLSNNSLSGLPPELGKMTTLRRLLLNGNTLRTLRSTLVSGPTSNLLRYLRSRLSSDDEVSKCGSSAYKVNQIAEATRLSLSSKELSLSGLKLESVPSTAWESYEIVKIDLSMNLIEILPEELSFCSKLEHLILSKNKIKQWPGALFTSLHNLSCLKLDNNMLKKIPSNGFQGLSQLKILDLSGNASSYPEPPGFSGLTQLQELHLRRMQLIAIPLDVLGLRQLHILDLSQNSIATIPIDMKNFISLTELDVSDNNITSLPAELGLLESSLQVFKLDGNPLRSIRRAILDRGTKDILKYLKDRITT
ncbi:hypothetical protein ZOSMA_283G00130 [Zostera marina]|uniref:Cytochrome P450 n=1 Tax=Zostera marina TaxID=29655 RepID=A0A0K9PF82_ZOSMR|nr:hypothetical protein ZOSMA_283G00130 [Zostera marina]